MTQNSHYNLKINSSKSLVHCFLSLLATQLYQRLVLPNNFHGFITFEFWSIGDSNMSRKSQEIGAPFSMGS